MRGYFRVPPGPKTTIGRSGPLASGGAVVAWAIVSDPVAHEAATSSRRRGFGLASIVGTAIALGGLAFVTRILVEEWDETRELISQARWGWLVLAVIVCLTGMTSIGMPWRAIIAALGEKHTFRDTLRWYFPGQLGKYIPGGIWPVVGRGELAVKGGVSRIVAYTSVGLSLALTYLACGLVALCFLVIAVLSGDDAGSGLWALSVLPLGLVVLHPRILRLLLSVAERALSRDVAVNVPPYRTTLRLLVSHAPAWTLIGTGTWLVARAFDPSAPFAQVAFAGVLSWLVGFIIIPVPGGIGVREVAFAAAAVSLSSDLAATVAIVSRLCFVTSDLAGAGLVMLLPRSQTKATPAPPRAVGPTP